jgi:hypothetical protein
MNHHWKALAAIIGIAAVVLAGCNYPSDTQDDELATMAASTVEAAIQLTELAATLAPPTLALPTLPSDTATPEPTIAVNTPTPAPPTVPPASVTPSKPCNAAQFVSDVNYPDNTAVTLEEDFTKTWRLKNVGTCTWTSGYKVVFDSGDRMDAPSSQSFTSGSIDPGETVDISVDLTAPDDSGTYQGNFRLKEPGGVLFGIGPSATGVFWVKVKAVSEDDLLADLVVSQIRVDPSPPIEEDEFEVRVTIKNEGGEVAEDFDVEWWSSTGAASPVCDWHVDDLEPGDDGHLYCNYTYQSNYASIDIKAVVDVDDDVDESDEGNNTRVKTISVTDID